MAATNVLLTYDLNTGHREVKDAMLARGYQASWTQGQPVAVVLPNTTLWKSGDAITQTSALADLVAVVQALAPSVRGLRLERAAAVTFTAWQAI